MDLAYVDEIQDVRFWTVAEAARLLERDVNEVRVMIVAMNISPVGTRPQDGPERRGRRPRVYRALDLIKAYDVLAKAA